MKKARRRLSQAEREVEILEASLRVFDAQPYQDISVERIAKEAGISAGLLYHYFPDKGALFGAAYDYLAKTFVRTLTVESKGSPWETVEAGLDNYLQYAENNPRTIKLILRPGGIKELGGMNDRINLRYTKAIAEILGIKASDSLRLIAIRSWIAFTDKIVLDWIEEKRKKPRARIHNLTIKVLRSALES